MPKIDDYIVQRIIDGADIETVVGSFFTLRKAGVNRTCLCPFHEDRHTGNFIVRPKGLRGGNTYTCFACGAKGDAVKFLREYVGMSFQDAIRWLGQRQGISIDDVPVNYTPPPRKPAPAPLPVLEIPRSWVKRTMELAEGNTFVKWYTGLPWSDTQRDRLLQTLWMYAVGGYTDGSVCYWQIDENGVPRAAKLMKYQPDGHRCKGRYDTSYLYSKPECKARLNTDGHDIVHPLFGAHLLNRFPEATVNVVESEKTALILANFYGQPERHLFLACGGLQFMKLEVMQPLIDQQRTVWLWPDKDGINKWEELAAKLGSENIHIYKTFFETHWRPEDGDKADAADITIRMMTRHEIPDTPPYSITLQEMMAENENVKLLIDTLDLIEI